MNYQHIISFQGGYLAYDILENDLIITDIFSNRLIPLYFEGEIFIIKDNLKQYLYIENNKINFTYLKANSNIQVKINHNEINILGNNKFLQCYPNKDLRFNAEIADTWETFYLRPYNERNSSSQFEKDNFIIINRVNKSAIPKIIWIYWEQDEKPHLIKKCINRIELLNPEYKINILNKDNLHFLSI